MMDLATFLAPFVRAGTIKYQDDDLRDVIQSYVIALAPAISKQLAAAAVDHLAKTTGWVPPPRWKIKGLAAALLQQLDGFTEKHGDTP